MSHKRHHALLDIRMPSELKAVALQIAQSEGGLWLTCCAWS